MIDRLLMCALATGLQPRYTVYTTGMPRG